MTKTAQGFWRATITFIGMAAAHKRAIRTAYTLTFLHAWIISCSRLTCCLSSNSPGGICLTPPMHFSTCRIGAWTICDGVRIRGGLLEERGGPAEDLSEGVARQVSLVGSVPRHLP